MAQRITRDTLNELLQIEQQICLSLYMPTQRTFPQSNQNMILYKNLLKDLRQQLSDQHPEADQAALLQPFERLLDDHEFWIHQGDGLAVLGGEDFFKIYTLQRRVPERVSVNSHPFVTPLMRIAQSADCYQVLCLTRDEVRLFEGNRDALEEIQLAPQVPTSQEDALGSDLTQSNQTGHPDGFSAASRRGDPYMHESGGSGKQDEIDSDRDRFFRELDRALLEHHSKPSRMPLIVAALPENQSSFRAGSHNPFLIEEGINKDPSTLSTEDLRTRCWEVMSQRYEQRLDAILDEYGVSRGQGLASDQPEDIGPAAASGRVATLLVEAERAVPGHLDQESGEVQSAAPGGESEDLLDSLIMKGMQNGGEVVVVPRDRMPSKSGVAAVYRF